ncbi:MAG: mechanosensitive ion channel [Xanthomonadaceae bacterium]|nr:mechanosensitive ion channel [Xanthomonadaceae bacterium]MDP2184301.1 mechanosensitive ion channel [Xanthomonadales bacterium]MDZ4377740.1 mechanosensitive ion channel [Xanthomonadaceae bacterium]
MLTNWLQPLHNYPWAVTTLLLIALLAAALLADWSTRRVLMRLATRLVQASATQWDDALLARGVLERLAHVLPALVIYAGIVLIPGIDDGLQTVVRNVAAAYIVLTVAHAISALLNGFNDLYITRDPVRAQARPIKGYLQVVKIVLFIAAAILIVAVLIERSPLLLFSGLGAMTAVLMLVFKDTILSLVASVQLSSNDMVRVGDWIEMPQLGADGDVIDIALHTVKVQNWDKTITTIPTYRLINESFRNWRGMSDAGGRRIMRALLLDQGSVRFLSDEEREDLRRIALIDGYLEKKRDELEAWNKKLLAEGKDPVNSRRVTNIGTFRAYVEAYLRAHPHIHQQMTLLVRQLAPGADGLPLQIYCFTTSTQWAVYESIQSDIFDHLLAILPRFGLRVFQSPSGADVSAVLQQLGTQRANDAAD